MHGRSDKSVVRTQLKESIQMRRLCDRAFEDDVVRLLRHPHRDSLHECLGHILASIVYGQQRVRLMVRFRDEVEKMLLNVNDAPGLAMAATSLSDVGSALTTQ